MNTKKILLALFLVFVVLVSGCTQQNQKADDTKTMKENNDKNQENDNATEKNNEPESNGAFSELVDLLSGPLNYKATYTTTSTTQGETFEGGFTLYFKGNEQRIDTDAGTSSSRTWVLEDLFVICTDSGEGETCFELENQDTGVPGQELSAESLKGNAENYSISPLPPRTIAGETGLCFEIIFTGEGTSKTEYCSTSDGILLYTKGSTKATSWEMVATSVTKNVTDAEMTPPEAQSFEDLFPEGFDPSNFQ